MRQVKVAIGCALLGSSVAAWSSETITYTYDAKGRLVQVVRTGGPGNGTQQTYTHDAAGNRQHVVVTGAPSR